jgi:MFS family permease
VISASTSNTRKIYAFSFFWMFLVIIPVIVPYCLQLGLTMQEFFELQAVFGITVVALEVPTGYLCDIWGRRKSMLIGTFLSGISFSFLALAKGYWDLVFYEVMCGTAMSFVSGADVSLLFESEKDGNKADRSRALANMQTASLVGEGSAALLGGWLGSISLKFAAYGSAVCSWFPFLIALTIKEPNAERMQKGEHRKNISEVLTFLFRTDDKFFRMVFWNGVVWGVSTFFAVWIYQKYWETRGISVAYFGLLWSSYSLTAALMVKSVGRLRGYFSEFSMLLAAFLFPIIGYIGMSLSGAVMGVFFGMIFCLTRGITGVILKSELNEHTPPKMRATVNSIYSFFFRLIFGVFGPAVGWSIDHKGVDWTLQALGIAFALALIFLGWPMLKTLPRELRAGSVQGK